MADEPRADGHVGGTLTLASRLSSRGGSGRATAAFGSLAVVTNMAFSLRNFRGPLIEELVRRGVRVYAVAPDYTPKSRTELRTLGARPVDCRMERARLNPLQEGLDVIRLSALLRRLAPDAVFAYFMKPVIYGSLAARFVGIQRRFALIAGAGYVFGDSDKGRGVGLGRRALRLGTEQLCRVALSGVDCLFVQNSADEELFGDRSLGGPTTVIRLPGTGVELDRFQRVSPVTEPVTFLLVARLLVEKGIRQYVAAARRVKGHHPEARFLLVGGADPTNPGSLEEDEVRAWVDEGLLEWPGWVDDVRPWIAQASVFVLPSYYREGVPRSTQEAMAMGRPVITTDAPGCRETVFEGKNGFLVPARDVGALADAMVRFVERPELIPQMGAVSRRLAERKFDVHEVNRTILEAMGL